MIISQLTFDLQSRLDVVLFPAEHFPPILPVVKPTHGELIRPTEQAVNSCDRPDFFFSSQPVWTLDGEQGC